MAADSRPSFYDDEDKLRDAKPKHTPSEPSGSSSSVRKVLPTPGPWDYWFRSDGTNVGPSADEVVAVVARVPGDADARLIAAAPELAEVAREWFTIFNQLPRSIMGPKERVLQEKAEAALRKAGVL